MERADSESRLRDHSSGQIVNMFAQYLFLARVQFLSEDRIAHPRDAKAACRIYIGERRQFQYQVTATNAEATRTRTTAQEGASSKAQSVTTEQERLGIRLDRRLVDCPRVADRGRK